MLIRRQPSGHAVVLDSNIFCRAASINDEKPAFLMQLAAKLFCGTFVEEGVLHLSWSRWRLSHSEFTDHNKSLRHALTRRAWGKKGQAICLAFSH